MKENAKKGGRAILIALLLLYIAIMAAAAFRDLQISDTLVNTENPAAKFLEIWGEPPSLVMITVMASAVALDNLRREVKSKKSTGAGIFLLFASLITCGYIVFRTMAYYGIDAAGGAIPMLTGAGISILLFLAVLAAAHLIHRLIGRLSPETKSTLLTEFARCVMAALFVLLTINLMKTVWGRWRYREMLAEGNFSNFTPWYVISGANGHKSFPSGHSANAALFLGIFRFRRFFGTKKQKIVYGIIAAILVLWVLAVMFSRVVIGAHFLSDIATGTTVTAALLFLSGLLF